MAGLLRAFVVAVGAECSDAAGVGVVALYAVDDAVAGVDAVDDADSDAGGAADDDAADGDAGTGSALLRRLATVESSIDQSSPGAWHCRCCWRPPSC